MLARAAALAVVLLSPSAASAQLLVTSETQGILRVHADGTVEDVLSRTPAIVGRMRDAAHVVFLVRGSNELRELDLATRTERTVATLPGDLGLGCGGSWGTHDEGPLPAPYQVVDHVQFAESFAADSTRAYFEVMDRNLNMASVLAQIEVDLGTGAVSPVVTLSETCGTLEDSAREALPCSRMFRAEATRVRRGGRARAGSWSVAEAGARGFLVDPRGRRRGVALREPSIELVSPSGRWAVVSANRDEGDYIYRDLFLLELRRGRLFPIVAPERQPDAAALRAAWPRPIGPRELSDAERLADLGHSVVGETAVRWMGETLVLGERLLVRPGRGSVRLPGPLVR